MKFIEFLAACTVLFATGCEPNVSLRLERHGEAYEFELRQDGTRALEAESFGVMEGARVVCEVRQAPGPGSGISRWTYGSRPAGYSISPHCEPLQPGKTYRAMGGAQLIGVVIFRLKANGDVDILEQRSL
jgi:hypothetical protein